MMRTHPQLGEGETPGAIASKLVLILIPQLININSLPQDDKLGTLVLRPLCRSDGLSDPNY